MITLALRKKKVAPPRNDVRTSTEVKKSLANTSIERMSKTMIYFYYKELGRKRNEWILYKEDEKGEIKEGESEDHTTLETKGSNQESYGH